MAKACSLLSVPWLPNLKVMGHGHLLTDWRAAGVSPSKRSLTKLLPITVFVAPRSTTPIQLYVANMAACSPGRFSSAFWEGLDCKGSDWFGFDNLDEL